MSSSSEFQVAHAVFFPWPTNADTVSQPVKAWNIGRASDSKQEDILWAAKYRKPFPVPNASHTSVSDGNVITANTSITHVAHAAQHGHRKILVRTVDTDVVVLAVMVSQTLPSDTEVWLAFGTGKGFRYLAAHRMSSCLGPEKSLALPMFHALTGCDTVSAFVGHGKKTAWATWNSLPELTGALLTLAHAPTGIMEEAIIYDRMSTCTDIKKARKKLFTKKSSVLRIPPTQAALVQHVKRAAFQGGPIWSQTLLPQPALPSSCNWGWIKTDGLYEPLWTTLPEASKSCYELAARKDMSNAVNAKSRTPLCWCEGECARN